MAEDYETNMDTLTSFSIIALTALIHASFQLSVSMVTLLSNHATGHHVPGNRVLRLVGSFFCGTVITIMLITAALAYSASLLFPEKIPAVVWSTLTGVLVGVGVIVWVIYYRRGDGTALWLPRSFARFLDKRTRATNSSVEAFSLGQTSIIAELIFIIAPAAAAALSIISLPQSLQALGVVLYTAIASLGMIIISVLIGSGHNLSHIQRWRENNKRFLQFAAGAGLIIVGFYLYVTQVVSVAAAGALVL